MTCSECLSEPDGITDRLWRASEGEWFCPVCAGVFGIKESAKPLSDDTPLTPRAVTP